MDEQANHTNFKTIFHQLSRLIRRIPFTICMVAILIVVAWATHSYFQELARNWIERLGFAPNDFWLFRWERLVLSALVTQGGLTFWFAVVATAVTSGLAEWKSGTLRTFVAFWGVHLGALMLESALFLLPLHRLGFPAARAAFFSRNVGPSAGYMGLLGYLATFLPKRWRWLAFSTILVGLLIVLFIPPRPGQTLAIKLADDMAHLIAFPLGWLTAYLIRKNNAR
ncbi:MAG TPA: rhomboid family intramembrane serine protease [Anaerolineales bacterium]|nr:rhomboid family intramembrane serine protease [Anaerolineales bacterium]